MEIVEVEDSAPFLLKPSVSGSGIDLLAYDESIEEDVEVPAGDTVRNYYKPPLGGASKVETHVLDAGGTAFTVTDASGTWARPSGAGYCYKELEVPLIDNQENTYTITIAVAGGASRNQTIIIRRKPN